jgi:hypothetical protein
MRSAQKGSSKVMNVVTPPRAPFNSNQYLMIVHHFSLEEMYKRNEEINTFGSMALLFAKDVNESKNQNVNKI